MHSYRITKYNPAQRGIKDGWTSVSDINRVFNRKILSVEEYLEIENSYIEFVSAFVNATNEKFKVFDFEDRRDSDSLKKYAFGLDKNRLERKEFTQLNTDDILFISRMCLRELVWCKIETASGVFIHFGYDYYMYLGSTGKTVIVEWPNNNAIFIEDFMSPYII